MQTIYRLSLLFTLALLSLPAQVPSGTLEGTIRDQTGASLPQAAIVMRQTSSDRQWQASSSSEGSFRITNLLPGAYRVRISAPGFSPVERPIEIANGATVTLQETLAAGAVTESVQISGNATLLQTNRATQTATLTTQELVNLPTASRNVTHLLVAEAGVNAPLPDRTGRGMNIATTPGDQAEDATQSLNPSVNGARPSNNAISINGIDTTNMMNGGGGLGNNLNVPLDALEMVEFQTALYSAATGRNGGGNVQLLTKSGTNQVHGSVYHFLQNEAFNANEFFLNRGGTRRPNFRRNETGGTVGGPIRRDRTFYFLSLQRTDFQSGYASNATGATGLPTSLTDTRTRESIAGVANDYLRLAQQDDPRFASTFLTFLRTWPGAQRDVMVNKFFSDPTTLAFRTLAATDINPVSINVLNQKRDGKYLIPSPGTTLPILPGNGTYGREVLLQQVFPTQYNAWNGVATIEQHVSSNNRLRLNYVKGKQQVEEAFGWAKASPSPTLGDTSSYTASLSDTHTFGPHWLNDLRGGFFDLNNTRISKNRDITNSSLGINNPLERAFGGFAALMPTIDIATQRSSGGIGNAWDFFDRQRVINIADTVSYTNGKHTVQFGGEFRRPTIKGDYMSRTNGDLDFDNWALFFTGDGAVGGGSDLDQGDTRRHLKMKDYSLFVQDDWKVRRGLTLNLGVRYDFYGNPVDTEGRIGNYYTPDVAARLGVQPGFQIPANSVIFQPGFTPLQLGLLVAPSVKLDYSQVHKAPTDSTLQDDRNNFAPRIGLAWQPGFTSKLVLRAGYGMFYERTSGTFKVDIQRTAPFFIYQNVPAPPDFANPYPELNISPFELPLTVRVAQNATGTPRFVRADGSEFPAQSPFSSKSNSFIDPFTRTPYVQQWSMDMQYEITPGNLFDIRYVGSRGVGLLAKLNLAQPRDPREFPVNGFSNIYDNAGRVINPDFFVQPQYLGLSRSAGFQVRSNWGQSVYHGLQTSFKRRFSRGVAANVAYTWSKSIDNVSSDAGLIEHNVYEARGNRGLSDFDRPHRVTAALIWQLPAASATRLTRGVTGGWSLSSLITLQSGAPFSVLGNVARNAIFAQPTRVRVDWAPGKTASDAVGSGRIQDRLDNYFNVSAFGDSLDHWGTTGRNILRGPGQRQLDLTLSKDTKLAERTSLEFRWEMYNLTNTASFANPASTFAGNGAGTAGRITATIGGPRTMQGALRLRF